MASKIKVDQIQTADGSGTIALQNQLSGMTNLSLPTGSVLQVVTDVHQSGSHISTTSTSFIDSELAATITPIATSSKILIMVSMGSQAPAGTYGKFQLLRGSTVLAGDGWAGASGGTDLWISHTQNWIDSPSTTSATTYKVKVKSNNSSYTYYYHHSDRVSTITLMEIAG